MPQQLWEQARPTSWAEVVGQDKALATIERARQRGGVGGRAWWITGKSGTGKSCIARLLAAEVAPEWGIVEVNGESLTKAMLEGWAEDMRFCTPQAYIINEVHALKKPVVRALLSVLEPRGGIPDRVVFVFTTTVVGAQGFFEDVCPEEEGPLLSRCVQLPLAQRDIAAAYAERAHEIAERQGLNGCGTGPLVKFLQSHNCNMRKLYDAIEFGQV